QVSDQDKEIQVQLHGDIVFDKVSFSYPTRPDLRILKDVSFHVESGKKLAIVGPSGTGKSTIASLILQFYQPSGGVLKYDGHAANELALTDIRNQVAIVPQD